MHENTTNEHFHLHPLHSQTTAFTQTERCKHDDEFGPGVTSPDRILLDPARCLDLEELIFAHDLSAFPYHQILALYIFWSGAGN